MVTLVDRRALTVIAATRLEARAARRALPGVRVVESGIALRRCAPGNGYDGELVVTCGLAGALRDDLPTGTVIVPETVLRPSGEILACDAQLVTALDDAARRLGFRSVRGPLVTSTTLITGDARRTWAQRGYAAVDMETGLVKAPRVAAIRVILDTPEREISAPWLQPAMVLLHPLAWREIAWLAREAPRCAHIAAAVLAHALER